MESNVGQSFQTLVANIMFPARVIAPSMRRMFFPVKLNEGLAFIASLHLCNDSGCKYNGKEYIEGYAEHGYDGYCHTKHARPNNPCLHLTDLDRDRNRNPQDEQFHHPQESPVAPATRQCTIGKDQRVAKDNSAWDHQSPFLCAPANERKETGEQKYFSGPRVCDDVFFSNGAKYGDDEVDKKI